MLFPQADFIGTSRFEVLGKLGAGGMGVVYEALDREQGNRVALKMLRRLEPDALMRFKQEFRALADVDHPNLVGLRELVCEGDHWFVTMELIEGVDFLRWVRPGVVTTFADTLASDPPAASGPPAPSFSIDPSPTAEEPTAGARAAIPGALDVSRLRAALHQLGAGVQALHRLGKLHCDLKPSNVLVTPKGRVVLLDFGLMTDLDLDGRRSADTIVGTAGYMPPEQGASARLTEAADWYAVGSMLYEALTGRLPYSGSTLQMLMAKRQQDPPPPQTFAPDVPADLAELAMELLRRDPGARPSGKEILLRLGASSESTGHIGTRTERVPLVGRERERAVLSDALASATAGTPTCVVVHGLSGMGKSTLVRRFLSELAEPTVVLAGRCYERESVPYKALDSLVDALCRHLRRLTASEVKKLAPVDAAALVRVFPVLTRVAGLTVERRALIPDSGEVRRRAATALRELLGKLAARAPLVLFIDDLQWGDADSSILLGELLAPPDPPPLLLIACHRSEGSQGAPGGQGQDSPVLATLRAPRPGVETRSLEIGALGNDDALSLARVLLGERDGHFELAAREAQGSPFLLVQLAQHLHSGEGLAAHPGPKLRFEDLVRARLARLGARERRLLELVAVAGRPLAKEVARAAAGIEALDDTLAPLLAGQLLRTSRAHGRDTIECYHDRIRETVAGLLEGGSAAAHHAQLARTLEAQGGEDAEALALHYEAAGQRQRAGAWAVIAADRAAAALAFDHAAELYRRALAGGQESGDERRELEARLAAALAGAGRGQEAAHAYLVAAAGAPREVALERRQHAAQQFMRAGYIDEGEAVLRQVLAEVGVPGAPETTARIVTGIMWNRLRQNLRGYNFVERPASTIPAEELAKLDTLWGAATGLAVVDFLRPLYFHQLHLWKALALGEPNRIACGLSLEAGNTVAHEKGAVAPRSAKLLARARELAEHTGDPRARATVLLMTGVTELQLAHWAPGLVACDEAEVIFRERCSNVAWEVGTSQLISGTCLAFLGRYDELQRRVPPLLREGKERGDLYVNTSAPGFLHLAWIAADEIEDLRTTMRTALARWSPRGYHVQHNAALSAEVDSDLYLGDAASAWRRAEADWPRLGLLLRSALARHGALSVMGRAALGNATAPEAPSVRMVERCIKRLERDNTLYPVGQALIMRAGLAAVRGDHAAAIALYEKAQRLADELEMGGVSASARRRIGQLRGGDEGAACIAEADRALAAQRVKNPARFAAMLAPAPCLD